MKKEMLLYSNTGLAIISLILTAVAGIMVGIFKRKKIAR